MKAYQGNALKLSRFADETFDMTLLLGPMYHLYTFEDKVKALCEAKRVTKKERSYFCGISDERLWCFDVWI